MAKWLIAGSIAIPMLLGGVLWRVVAHGPSAFTSVVYTAASRICHQRPERSFHTAGVQWPVCGRCSGLYLGGAIGGIAAGFRRRRVPLPSLRQWIAVAAVPTLTSLALEWTVTASVGNVARALTAVPLGLAVAVAIVCVTEPAKAIR